MHTKQTSAPPYPSLRSNSESLYLHSQPVVGKDSQQARPVFLNGPVNSSTSMLASLPLSVKMDIESQHRVQPEENLNSRPSTPSNTVTPASSVSSHADPSERPSTTASSNTR